MNLLRWDLRWALTCNSKSLPSASHLLCILSVSFGIKSLTRPGISSCCQSVMMCDTEPLWQRQASFQQFTKRMGFHTRSRHFLNRSLVHFHNSEIQKRHMTHTESNPQSVWRVWARLGFPAHTFWPSQSSRVFGGEITGRLCTSPLIHNHSYNLQLLAFQLFVHSYSNLQLLPANALFCQLQENY